MNGQPSKFTTDKFTLAVEHSLFVEFPRLKPGHRFQCKLLGYHPDSSIMITLPGDKQESLSFLDSDACTVRYLDGQNACAFESAVQHVSVNPFRYLHLYFPRVIECVRLREGQRFSITLNASICCTAGSHHSVLITNLSEKGVGLVSTDRFAEVGEKISLDVPLPNGMDGNNLQLTAEIRNIHVKTQSGTPGENTYQFGARFVSLDPTHVSALNDILYHNVAGLRAG